MYQPEPVEETTAYGLSVKVYHDDTGAASSPREWDQLGTMVYWHRDYVLGDREIEEQEREALARGGWVLLARYLRRFHGAVGPIIKLGLIDHSTISMYADGGVSLGDNRIGTDSLGDSRGWDSGTVGFIYATRERMDVVGTPEDRIEECLRGEIQEFDDYLTGNVYGYVVEDREGNTLDSCWGFYPDHDAKGMPWADCMREALDAAKHHATELAVAP
jgi:hypothetical protein